MVKSKGHHFSVETFLLSTIMKNKKTVNLMKKLCDQLTLTQSSHKK